MKLPEKAIEYIEKKLDDIEYGQVTITKNNESANVDVIVEERKRFKKEKEVPPADRIEHRG